MLLTQATQQDFSAVCALYQSVCAGMAASSSPQWVWGEYPAEDILQNTLEAGTLYIAKDGDDLLCAVTVDTCFDPEYAGVNWLFGVKPGAFHRLAIVPAHQGKGLGKQFFDFIDRQYTDCIFRLEVEKENLPAVRLYTKCGFTELPYIEMKK